MVKLMLGTQHSLCGNIPSEKLQKGKVTDVILSRTRTMRGQCHIQCHA